MKRRRWLTVVFAFISFGVFSTALLIFRLDKLDAMAIRSELERSVANSQSDEKSNEKNGDNEKKRALATKEVAFEVNVVYSEKYLIDLGGAEKLHSFDIRKYEKIHNELIKDGILRPDSALEPELISADDLLLVHSAEYLEKLGKRANVARYLEAPVLLGLPVSLNRQILHPFRYATGGTLLAAREALKHGIGINIGGGYHHAKKRSGEGFCLYADVPVAIRKLQKEKRIAKALIIDVDVHQGNGTINCLRDDDSTFTFSMHQSGIYPIPKEVGDRDVELPAGMQDDAYLEILETELPKVFAAADADICFIVAGCDTLAGDPLASLKMTHAGVIKRDLKIVAACVQNKIPVVYTTSGGYSDGAWKAQYGSIRKIIETYGLASDSSSDNKNREH